MIDFVTAAVFSGILEGLGDRGFRKAVALLFDRGMEAPVEEELQRSVRAACLLATESACKDRLKVLEGVVPFFWWMKDPASAEASEARWLQRTQKLLKRERMALSRGEQQPFQIIKAEELAWLVQVGDGIGTEPVQRLSEALVTRVLNDLELESGQVPDTFRCMLREGWAVEEEEGVQSELQNWFSHVCDFFRHELQRREPLRHAIQTQILAKLATNGIGLTLPEFEAHLASNAGRFSARLDEFGRVLSRELRESTQAIFEELRELRGSEHREEEAVALPDKDILLAYLDWLEARHRELKIPGIPGVAASPVVELERVYVALKGDYVSSVEQRSARELLDLEWRELEGTFTSDSSESDSYAQRAKLMADRALPLQRVPGAERQTLTLGEAFRREPRLVILGGPGAGKTTLVRWLTLKLAVALREGRESVQVPAYQVDPEEGGSHNSVDLGLARLPILLRVNEFARELLERKTSLDRFLGWQSWSEEHPVFPRDFAVEDLQGAPIPPEQLNRLMLSYLRRGRAVVILDGLDEVPDGNDREAVVGAIEIFLFSWINAPASEGGARLPVGDTESSRPTHGDNQIVITSRITGYDLAPISSIPRRVVIQEMSDQAVRTFCDAWALAIQDIEQPGLDPLQRRERAASHAERLKAALFDPQRPRVRELASNPLLVTILAIVEREEPHKLPEHRTRLYDIALRYMIKVWREPGLSEREMLYVLSPLAYQMHLRSERTLARRDVLLIVEEHLALYRGEEVRPAFREQVDRFLVALGREAGILVEQGKDLYGFLHQGFQEYLAARFLLRHEEHVYRRLAPLLGIPRWREPLLMTLGYVSWGEEWSEEERESLFEALLADDDRFGGILPRAALLIVSALPEMAQPPSLQIVTRVILRLVGTYADRELLREFPALAATIEGALQVLLQGALGDHTRQTLTDLLIDELDTDNDNFLATAALLGKVAELTHDLVDVLVDGVHLDSEVWGWPVHRILQDVACKNPELLPAYRLPLRQVLMDEPELALRVALDPDWQRMVVALCGGYQALDAERKSSMVFSPSALYRNTTLTPLLLGALREERPARSLAGELSARAESGGSEVERIEAFVALALLGEDVSRLAEMKDDPARRHILEKILGHMSRMADLLAPVVTQNSERLAGIMSLAAVRQGRVRDWLRWREDSHLPGEEKSELPAEAFGDRLFSLIQDFAAAPDGDTKTQYLADLFAYLFSGVHSGDLEKIQLAIAVLDVAGRPLEASPSRVAEALLIAWNRRNSSSADHTPMPAGTVGSEIDGEMNAELITALDAIPDSLDIYRAWLLDVLGPVFAGRIDQERGNLAASLLPEQTPDELVSWRDTKDALLDLLPTREARSLVTSLLSPLRGGYRAASLVDRLALEVADDNEDPSYSACVALDTLGAVLNGPPHHLAWALAHSHFCQGSRFRSWRLEALYPRLRTDREVLIGALAAVDAFPPELEIWRSWILAELAALFRGDDALLLEAFAVALRIDEEEFRRVAIRALCEDWAQSEDPFTEALAGAKALLNPVDGSRVLWRLARALSGTLHGSGEVILLLLESLRLVSSKIDNDPRDQALMLTRLLLFFPASLTFNQTLESSTRRISDPDDRARAFARLAILYDGEPRTELLHDALAAVRAITDERARAETLAEIEPLLFTRNLASEGASIATSSSLSSPINRALLEGSRFAILFRQEPLLLEPLAGSGSVQRQQDVSAWVAVSLTALAGEFRDHFAIPYDLASLWRALSEPRSREDAATALCHHATEETLELTVAAALTLDQLLEEGALKVVRMVLPVVGWPTRASLPIVQRWLDCPDPEVRRCAVVLLAEAGELKKIVPDLLVLLQESDDRCRNRVALSLFRRPVLDRLCVSALGPETLEELAAAQSAHRSDLVGTVLLWMWENSVVFDAPEALETWCRRTAEGDRTAEMILESIHRLDRASLGVVCRFLSDGPETVQEALLRGVERVFSKEGVPKAGVPDLRSAVYRLLKLPGKIGRLARRALSEMRSCTRDDMEIFIKILETEKSTEALIDFGRLTGFLKGNLPLTAEQVLKEYIAHDPRLAAAAASGIVRTWSNFSAQEIIDRLLEWIPANAGKISLIDALIYAARDRYWGEQHDKITWACGTLVEMYPDLLEVLISKMHQTLFDENNPDRETILAFIAEVAERMPRTYAAKVNPKLTERQLVRAFGELSWLARRSAIRALGALRFVTPQVVSALQAAMHDVEEVQNVALTAAVQFRHIRGEFLAELLRGFDADPGQEASASSTYATGRLLEGLGRSDRVSFEEQQQILQMLANAVRKPSARRPVYILRNPSTKQVTEDGFEYNSPGTPSLKYLGRLDHCLYQVLTQVAGFSTSTPANPNPGRTR